MQDQTITAYDTYATVYDNEVVRFWQEFPRTFINHFVQALPGKRILDLGSGSGRDAMLLREQGLEVACVDASQTMANMTRKLGFETYVATFSQLPFDTASFDGVWAYTSLLHVPGNEMRRIIGQIHGLLRSNGVFAIGMIEGATEGMVERVSMPGGARYFKYYGQQELKDLIEPLGFEFLYEQDYQPHNHVYLNQLYKKQ